MHWRKASISKTFAPGIYYVLVRGTSENGLIQLNVSNSGSNCVTNRMEDEEYITETESNFSVFPNPSLGIVNIRLENSYTGDIIVNDLFGKDVLRRQIESSSEIQIDLQDQAKGMYYIDIPGLKIRKMINVQ